MIITDRNWPIRIANAGSISVDVHTKLSHQIRTHASVPSVCSGVEGEQVRTCFLSQTTISLNWCKVVWRHCRTWSWEWSCSASCSCWTPSLLLKVPAFSYDEIFCVEFCKNFLENCILKIEISVHCFFFGTNLRFLVYRLMIPWIT